MKRMNGKPMSEITDAQPRVPSIVEMRGACDRFLFDRPPPKPRAVTINRADLTRFRKTNER